MTARKPDAPVDAAPEPPYRSPWSRGALLAALVVVVVLALAALLVVTTRPPLQPSAAPEPLDESATPSATPTEEPTLTPLRYDGPPMTQGCEVTSRGIPSCDGLVGAAFGANGDPSPWEGELGRQLGVRRTYYKSHQLHLAVVQAQQDLAARRIPWISFKVPYTWKEMADGRGDDWAREVVQTLGSVDGPVWLAFNHEPENDGGDVRQWRRMQERLGPIVRRSTENVAFTVVLMGYHQFAGGYDGLAMDDIWPRTRVDLAGFDIYGDRLAGGVAQPTDLEEYFAAIEEWSLSEDVPWALAETGVSQGVARQDPGWFRRTYRSLVSHGGKAFVYFNTDLNSELDRRLLEPAAQESFAALVRRSPSLR